MIIWPLSSLRVPIHSVICRYEVRLKHAAHRNMIFDTVGKFQTLYFYDEISAKCIAVKQLRMHLDAGVQQSCQILREEYF